MSFNSGAAVYFAVKRWHSNPLSKPESANVIALQKDSGHTYIFVYDSESLVAAVSHLGELAGDSECEFSWYDAGKLSSGMRSLHQRTVHGFDR